MTARFSPSAPGRHQQSASGLGSPLLARTCTLKTLTTIGVFAAVLAATSVADAASGHADRRNARGTRFDGQWSILIETKRGVCDVYRVGVDIVNGSVTYDGTAYGRVNAAGAVSVVGSMGGQNGQASGRLSRASGAGAWRAVTRSGPCSGQWTAERRG